MNRKILFQVAAPAIVIGLLLVGTCLVSAWSIDRLQTNLTQILSRNVAGAEAALGPELWRASNEQLAQTARESDEVGRQAHRALLLLGIGGPLGGVLCGYGIVRGLNRSIARLRVRVHDVVRRLHAPLPAPGPN